MTESKDQHPADNRYKVPFQMKITRHQKKIWKDFAAQLFETEAIQKPDVSKMIVLAVQEYRVNVSNYSPRVRTRLVKFAGACCGGNVSQAVEVMLNEVDNPKARP